MMRRNLIANYAGQTWIALMGLAFIPLYVRYLGIEAYGVIGLFAVLQTLMVILDLGMTPTLSREMARYTGGSRDVLSIRDLLRSMEIIAFAAAAVIAISIALTSSWIAKSWLRAEGISTVELSQAIALMGLVIALRFVEGIYRGSIIGLQRQISLNLVSSVMATVRGLGAVLILAWVAPTIQAYFIWQGFVSVMTVGALAWTTYRGLPFTERSGRFSLDTLREVWRFASGMIAVTALSMLLAQVDKVAVTRLLTLSDFGHYSLAASAAALVFSLIGPIVQAWYPQFNKILIADKMCVGESFHRAAQLVSVIVGSSAVVGIFFSAMILQLWTADAKLSHAIAPIFSLLVLGNLLNGLMIIPYRAQIAYGWTDLSIKISLCIIAVYVPTIIWATLRFGVIGAAFAWVAVNTAYILVGAHFVYRRILPTEKWSWYIWDVSCPIGCAALVAVVARYGMPLYEAKIPQLAFLAVTGIATLAAAAMAAPLIRKRLFWAAGLRIHGTDHSTAKP
ncbi:oligosaccharide flippase family protein [Mesorhizobium sp. M0959]|uniref:lipopolysaccharide biosynthesis protein n=1 Tax=unclassified Mesorhizobium TaxID=325217 RepID=UPI00333AA1E7